MPDPVTWDVLLPTIPHRHEGMCALLAEFDRQWQPGLGMLVMRDNLQRPGNASYAKWNELTLASKADYISFIGDDDSIAPDYVARVFEALEQRPDYVGYGVRYTYNGTPQVPVEHSLRHGRWENLPHMLVRDIVHNNPIKRELALQVRWATDHQSADHTWACDLRATGTVKTEVWIPKPMLYYQETAESWSRWGGSVPTPMPPEEIPAMPEYPWLTTYDLVNT